MFEYHGWISVRESAGADDNDFNNDRLREIVEGIQSRIREIDSPYLLDLRWMNGEPFLHLGGFPNHRDEDVVRLFAEVGERAPDSYGLLHIRDDEDLVHGNEVVVHRLIRGTVTEHTEPFLFPCVPALEDPFQG
ncbi:Imm7 family immunity protein [Actinacidiphila glaucinigra]|uniref:Imm7 family immunity protein n=1 Tax=Actinacidiphila glaucinigra TaxID=235986 RepID=UPI003798AD32